MQLLNSILAVALLASSASAQLIGPEPVPIPRVNAYISDQGASVIKSVTGQSTKGVTLTNVIACNESDGDVVVSVSRIYAQLQFGSVQHLSLVSSTVVDQMLEVFQQKDIYNRLFKGANAAANIQAILQTAFKNINPIAATTILLAPSLYQAILPVVHDPRDLRALSKQILTENTPIQLAARDCRSGLVVVRASTVTNEKVFIQ